MKTMPIRRNLVPIGNSDRNASKKILFLRNIPKAENTPATPGRKTPYWGRGTADSSLRIMRGERRPGMKPSGRLGQSGQKHNAVRTKLLHIHMTSDC